MNSIGFRKQILSSYGASDTVMDELLPYSKNRFDHFGLSTPSTYPMSDEPFAEVWEEYARESINQGVFECLKTKLVQLNFPIKKGISQTESYRSATRKGAPLKDMEEASGLVLKHPEKLRLTLHQSPAGRIPLIISGVRADFVSLLRAFVMKNEPKPVPDSMGAMMVAGFNNWDRIRRYRKQWEIENSKDCTETRWKEEFRKIIAQKELYQDRFIILSDGPYSAIPAQEMGMTDREWRRASLIIRQEHECAHYFTRRLYSSMSNNLHDEIIADYMGIVIAAGRYRADWFLKFMGLDDYPNYRTGGRLENYRGDPPLSDEAFNILMLLVKNAAVQLERVDKKLYKNQRRIIDGAEMIMALTELTLEELAWEKSDILLLDMLNKPMK